MKNQNLNHEKTLEILQTQYNSEIVDYTRLTSRVILLHFAHTRYDKNLRYVFERYYNQLAIQDGDKFKINKIKFGNVGCEKDGTIIADRTVLGISKKYYYNKAGKRIFGVELNK